MTTIFLILLMHFACCVLLLFVSFCWIYLRSEYGPLKSKLPLLRIHCYRRSENHDIIAYYESNVLIPFIDISELVSHEEDDE